MDNGMLEVAPGVRSSQTRRGGGQGPTHSTAPDHPRRMDSGGSRGRHRPEGPGTLSSWLTHTLRDSRPCPGPQPVQTTYSAN